MHIPFPREQFALQIPFFSQVLIVWTKSYDLESISEDTCVNHTQESINCNYSVRHEWNLSMWMFNSRPFHTCHNRHNCFNDNKGKCEMMLRPKLSNLASTIKALFCLSVMSLFHVNLQQRDILWVFATIFARVMGWHDNSRRHMSFSQ